MSSVISLLFFYSLFVQTGIQIKYTMNSIEVSLLFLEFTYAYCVFLVEATVICLVGFPICWLLLITPYA